MTLLRKYWFLLALVCLIPGGLLSGYRFGESPWLEHWEAVVRPRITTTIVLFLMSFTLDSRQIVHSLRAPGPVLTASLVNLGLIPLLALALVPLQSTLDFRLGLMIAASVPCTLAAASVWTRKALGDDAVSLLVTLLTNSLCVVVTPFWLSFVTTQAVQFDVGEMTLRLCYVVLLPTLLGQAARQLPKFGATATRFKIPLGVVAQSLILLLVFSAAASAGRKLAEPGPGFTLLSLLLVAASGLGLHLAAMLVAWRAGGWLKFPLPQRAAMVFAGSQKTLPIGVLLATDPSMFGAAGVPFAIFPMIVYHTGQLLIDTTIAQKLAALAPAATVIPPPETTSESEIAGLAD